MTDQSLAPHPVPGLGDRVWALVRALPAIGRVIRDIEREVDSIYYLFVIALTALVLAIMTWGLPALVLTAVGLVPVVFVLLIWVTLP
ncbi:MAG: hypothetical protein C0524_13810 [Rhodobacter sp.]|nr:hypothetical protein [Rhodobacter sp.]